MYMYEYNFELLIKTQLSSHVVIEWKHPMGKSCIRCPFSNHKRAHLVINGHYKVICYTNFHQLKRYIWVSQFRVATQILILQALNYVIFVDKC